MTEQKTKRMIVALTAGAVLLLVTLLSIMVYQMIAIKVEKNRIEYFNQKTAEYIELKKQGEETIQMRSMREWIEREARKLGLTMPEI